VAGHQLPALLSFNPVSQDIPHVAEVSAAFASQIRILWSTPMPTGQHCRHGSLLTSALLLAAAGVLARPVVAEPAEKDVPQAVDVAKLAEVFATKTRPDIKGKRWVSVSYGPANCSSKAEGWLIGDGPEEISLLDLDGETHKYRKPTADEKRPRVKEENEGGVLLGEVQKADHSVAWEVRNEDFMARTRKFIDDGLPKEKEIRDVYDFSHVKYSLSGRAIDAARLAVIHDRLGNKDDVAKLIVEASRAYRRFAERRFGAQDHTEPLHEFVATEIASGKRNGAIYSGHSGTAREELKRHWEGIAVIPYQPYQDDARLMVKHYESLLKEDREWVEPSAQTLAKMTDEQKVGYWLYHLRDLNVGQWSDPGHCYVLGGGFSIDLGEEKKKDKPNPAVELKKLGITALPTIIAHLDDPRPTRCKGHWRSYSPDGQHLLRYGDCCQQIFEAITGHTIFTPHSTVSYPHSDNEGKKCKERAGKWWEEFQKKGEKQMLVEGVRVGDHDSPRKAEQLAKKYPDAALAPIMDAARATGSARTRSVLVEVAADLKDDKVQAFLHEELKGPFFQARVKAAEALAVRGHPDGIKALLTEWKATANKDPEDTYDGWALDALIRCLVHCGDPDAVRVIGAEMGQHSVSVRATIVYEVGIAEKDPRDKPLTEAVSNAIEDLLIQAMKDLEQTNSYSSRSNGKSVNRPQIADLAAEALANRWKRSELFDITGPKQTRAKQRLKIENIWRERRGLKSLPIPADRRVEPAPDAKIAPLINAIREAKTGEERTKALHAIEELVDLH
jgi:hypothetical protein